MSCSRGAGAGVTRKYDLVDPATLDCPFCKQLLSPPVFQCREGHIVCSKCCEKVAKKCPSCSHSTGDIRCLAIESVLNCVTVSCKHAGRGCREMLKPFEIDAHETRLCIYAGTYRCPVSDCGHAMPMVKMLDHITNVHGGWNFMAIDSSPRSVKFSTSKGKRWKKFTVVTGTSAKPGSSFLVHVEEKIGLGVRFCCTSIGISKVFYNLKVKPRDGAASYVLETSAPFLVKKGELPCKRQSLVIPTDVDCEEACCKLDVELSFPEESEVKFSNTQRMSHVLDLGKVKFDRVVDLQVE